MRTRLLHFWDKATSSYWFIPMTMTAGALIAATALLMLDRSGPALRQWWLYSGGPEGARGLLATIASSVITVAGVVFSITIATLTQASSQFGPRLLRSFMRDTGNQVVLGTFVATFIYCIVVLRSVRSGRSEFVPHASITFAVALAGACIVVLIYFIHHTSVSLQAPQVVARAGRELHQSIRRTFPRQLGQESGAEPQDDPPPLAAAALDEGFVIRAVSPGYVQAIDEDALMDAAVGHDLVMRLERRPGHWVMAGSPLITGWPAGRCDESLTRGLCDAFILGSQRTEEQDAEYAISQMVEIAVRALSPGINDPFTAITCIDWLGHSLATVGRIRLPRANRYDKSGRLRIVAPTTTFQGLADAAFNQLRQNAQHHAAVHLRLLEVIGQLAGQLDDPAQLRVLGGHARLVRDAGVAAVPADADREAILARYAGVLESLRRDALRPEAGRRPGHSAPPGPSGD